MIRPATGPDLRRGLDEDKDDRRHAPMFFSYDFDRRDSEGVCY